MKVLVALAAVKVAEVKYDEPISKLLFTDPSAVDWLSASEKISLDNANSVLSRFGGGFYSHRRAFH